MSGGRRHHDMGGLEAGTISTAGHDKAPWEKRVDAIKMLLFDDKRRLVSTDELRRAIEDLGPDAYDKYSYYERWMAALTQILLEKEVFTPSELGERMRNIEARGAQKL
ncbi:MAG: ScnB-like protein [Pseudomonadota bacterium]